MSNGEKLIEANGVDLCVETFGDAADPAILLVHGASASTEAQFARVWRTNRPYLVNLAFGMLSDIGSAEDAVQDAFGRFADADYTQIEDHRAWLIVVTSRICLDQINSARSRREHAYDTSTIEFVGEPALQARPVDPADRVTLDDEVRTALLVVLERLTPAERVVFVLHDIFQTPFDSIAETVGKPAATCRQLARRARVKLQEEHARVAGEVDVAQHRLRRGPVHPGVFDRRRRCARPTARPGYLGRRRPTSGRWTGVLAW
jgi:RNA polymerase sigma-70 factor (ECF subfamily)